MSKIAEKELRRWGFFKREGELWYNNHLCMEFRVSPNFLNMPISEYDLIYAVFNHGRESGISEMQENIQRSIGIN